MSAPEMSSSDTPTDNGVNVQALLDARKALAEAPEDGVPLTVEGGGSGESPC